MFYAEFFNDVKKIVLLVEDDRLLVASAKSTVSDAQVEVELVLICLYRPLIVTMKKFESRNATIADASRALQGLMDTLRENDPAEFCYIWKGESRK